MSRTLVRAEGRAAWRNVELCKCWKACAVCRASVQSLRALEVGLATWRWLTGGDDRGAVFVSLAVGHKASDPFAETHGRFYAAVNAVLSHTCWQRRKLWARLGIKDVCWIVEATHGRNGGHPQRHLVLLTDHAWEAWEADHFQAVVWKLVDKELQARGFQRSFSPDAGVDVEPVDDPVQLGGYLAKWSIGHELADAGDKDGRSDGAVAFTAIPNVLASMIGRRANPRNVARRNMEVRRLVDAWDEYLDVVVADGDDGRKWYKPFRLLETLVPELKGVCKRAERAEVLRPLMPDALAPLVEDLALEVDAEDGDGLGESDGDGALVVPNAVWRDALAVYDQPGREAAGALLWARRYGAWLGPDWPAAPPLEAALAWLAEDYGIEAAAVELAVLVGGVAVDDGYGWTIETERRVRAVAA